MVSTKDLAALSAAWGLCFHSARSPSPSSQPVLLRFFQFTAEGDNPIPGRSDAPAVGLPGLPARMRAVLMRRLRGLQMNDRG